MTHFHLHTPDGECHGDSNKVERARQIAAATTDYTLVVVELDHCVDQCQPDPEDC